MYYMKRRPSLLYLCITWNEDLSLLYDFVINFFLQTIYSCEVRPRIKMTITHWYKKDDLSSPTHDRDCIIINTDRRLFPCLCSFKKRTFFLPRSLRRNTETRWQQEQVELIHSQVSTDGKLELSEFPVKIKYGNLTNASHEIRTRCVKNSL